MNRAWSPPRAAGLVEPTTAKRVARPTIGGAQTLFGRALAAACIVASLMLCGLSPAAGSSTQSGIAAIYSYRGGKTARLFRAHAGEPRHRRAMVRACIPAAKV